MTVVAAVCCCRKIENGRSLLGSRPLTWVGLTYPHANRDLHVGGQVIILGAS
jgi:hypothetical protein